MKVLLVGHEGYLGRGLQSALGRRHEVLGWGRREDLFRLDAAFLARAGIEALVNLASAADRTSRRFVVDGPSDELNVGGARHLARVLRGSGIAWIQLSSKAVLGPVYGPEDVLATPEGLRPRFLVDESRPYAPADCYGKSKVMAELISESHPASAVIRLSTCYTDQDHPRAGWMISLLRSAARGEPIRLTQGGLQFRDPLHVEDLARLVELVVERRVFGERLHAGGGEQNLISLLELVQLACPGAAVEPAPGGDLGFAFDNARALRLTGWAPRVQVRQRLPLLAEAVAAGLLAGPAGRFVSNEPSPRRSPWAAPTDPSTSPT
jgi:nucleoside-diphosphate-sugar epimerase